MGRGRRVELVDRGSSARRGRANASASTAISTGTAQRIARRPRILLARPLHTTAAAVRPPATSATAAWRIR